ncbi:MAG: membrane protein insertase YidC [candidate division KSB1 bacterium]|nr:membrane protein insertase YidC [candidate division KSB1 bacterium]
MDFDSKNTILAFILIISVIIFTQTDFYLKLVDPEGYNKRQQQLNQPETIQQTQSQESVEQQVEEPVAAESESQKTSQKPFVPSSKSKIVAQIEDLQSGKTEEFIYVETSLYEVVLTTRGGNILQWKLKNFMGPDSEYVNLFRPNSYGNFSLSFLTVNGDSLSTSDYIFESGSLGNITVYDSKTISFTLDMGNGRSISKNYTFHDKRYMIDYKINFSGLYDLVANKRYFISAPNGMASTEQRVKEDMQYAKAAVYSNENIEDGYKTNEKVYKESGQIEWAAVRTKYFAIYIVPEQETAESVTIQGFEDPVANKDTNLKRYSITMSMPYLGDGTTEPSFNLYLGPLEYDTLKKYDKGFEDFMDFGWSFIKPFSKFILWLFKKMHTVIPNYGVVLLFFAVVIKIVVYPLTHKSYESMQKMQQIQPKLKELQEKHKDDPQKLNKATMNLYKQEGVNPAGGCLPMLIQMPLLIGLFVIFRTTIELRGEGFIWWINDLSAPDTIFTLPFSIPFYGQHVNILPIFMMVTIFLQQKMSSTDPKQKMLVYFMPIFLFLLFNHFPSGLNLYYALFNLLSIIQQKYLVPKHQKKRAA